MPTDKEIDMHNTDTAALVDVRGERLACLLHRAAVLSEQHVNIKRVNPFRSRYSAEQLRDSWLTSTQVRTPIEILGRYGHPWEADEARALCETDAESLAATFAAAFLWSRGQQSQWR
ncbi:hypothetical protein [Rhodococcus sp. T7]|uniref:hypothetical protein n=1 Tax=Rhodococcus sp. T7 TaxID=627444 RepID=UPI001359891B|nr:hypothetical protein [Rhodococcus sp. T7]KAF0962825.1 hypothetical protein MLGJGCBP_04051 [Rhodococcus sp. T7]